MTVATGDSGTPRLRHERRRQTGLPTMRVEGDDVAIT